MKPLHLAALLVLAYLQNFGQATRLAASPVSKIVSLLNELKVKMEADSDAEQKAYDKYACWCEDTLAAKASEISTSKDQIETLQTGVVQLKADLGTHGADIQQLRRDISANAEAQREATEMREKEREAYQEERAETEQCIGALEAAIKVLAGAGGKKGFLETLQEVQLLGVAAGVRSLLRRPLISQTMGAKDLQVVRHFVDQPEDFVGGRTGVLSTAQIASNPFGDYAPQSTQIQGILKSMYDAFAGDLEKANGEEAKKQKGFQELMATKKAEQTTLQSTLQKQTSDEATKTVDLANSKASLDDTQAQLEADQSFFVQTKDSCAQRATELAQRARLRTEELHGIGQAIAVLSSPEAQKTFANASTTFMQISSVTGADTGRTTRERVYKHLRNLATRYNSVELARITTSVAKARDSGQFDVVIASIDRMIAVLREEANQDIVERDWCQGRQTKNKHNMEDINYDMTKISGMIGRMNTEWSELHAQVSALDSDINATKNSMEDLLQLRSQEHADFLQSFKDDTDAVALLEQAIATLTKFYRNNGIELAFVQNASTGAPPAAPWDGAYTGRQGESGGIVAILRLVKEDFEKEIQSSRKADAAAEVNFEKDRQALQQTLDAQEASKAVAESAKAAKKSSIADLEETQGQKTLDLEGEQEMQANLDKSCAWVDSHFDLRKSDREKEISGLVEAKNFLAGIDDNGI